MREGGGRRKGTVRKGGMKAKAGEKRQGWLREREGEGRGRRALEEREEHERT